MRRVVAFAVVMTLGSAVVAHAEEKPILVLDAAGHTASVSHVIFTPDARELITVAQDKTIRFWDVRTGQPLRTLRPYAGPGAEGKLYAAALSPDGQRLAVGGFGVRDGDNPILLISTRTGQVERALLGHRRAIFDLEFSPDGTRLISGSSDQTARVWDAATGKPLHVLSGHTAQVLAVTFSPDGRHAATASADATARIWPLTAPSPSASATLQRHTKPIRCIAWSPDGRLIATGGLDWAIHIWNSDGTHHAKAPPLENEIMSVAFTPDSKSLLLARGRHEATWGVCSVINWRTGEGVHFRRHTNTVIHAALSPRGDLAATTGGNDHETYIWRTADGSVVHRLASQGRTPWSAAWGGDGTTLAWGNTDDRENNGNNLLNNPLERNFSLKDFSYGRELAGMKEAELSALALGRARATRGQTSLVRDGLHTLDVRRGGATAASIKLHPTNQGEIRCFTLLPDDRAAVGADHGFYLYDTRTGQQLREFRGHTDIVWAVAPSPDDRWLLTASADQTLRIWDPRRADPLLSFFFAGNEWIAWTPEGYYAASPGGERLMGWQVNRGKGQMAEFHPAVRFRKELYRPDAIERLLAAGSLERALAEADAARKKKSELTDVSRILPPTVRITSPQPGPLARGTITVQAVAQGRGKHPVKMMRLLLDGQLFGGRNGIRYIANAPPEGAAASWDVELPPGAHRLQVLADSAVSQGASDEVVVTFNEAQAGLRPPSLVLLAIGVSKYANPGVARLDYAATDAGAVVRAFEQHSQGLFGKPKVLLLTDAEATKDNILKGLEWMVNETSQDDYAVIFFAGHGEADNSGNVYFLPVDADKKKLRSTALPGEEFIRAFRDLPPSKRVLMLDACHAGGVNTDVVARRRSGRSVTDDILRELLTPENGVVVMCSSTAREFSQESHEHRMGIFTLALTEGLAGKQGKYKDHRGLVYTHHLHAYVCDRVKELTNGEQHPVMKNPDEIRDFPLSRP